MKVMIVDDSKSIHSYTKMLLSESSDFEVIDFYDGQEAVVYLQNHKFDGVILLDWEMPIKNGPQTLVEIRSMGCKAGIVMVTTKNSLKDIQNMMESGADEYLMKPFTKDLLLEKINSVMIRDFKYAS